jgi:phosphoglycolate phosphatase-like HAD superfamily hydrolase
MKFEAYIFDLDATLIYTAPEHRRILVKEMVLGRMGKTCSDEDVGKFWFEMDRDRIIKEIFRVDPELFWTIYKEHDSVDLRKKYTKTYSDVKVLDILKKGGSKIGIFTQAPKHIADFEVSLLGDQYLDVVVSARESSGIRPKPHPHGLEECMRILGVDSDITCCVGNGREDILSAKAASVFDILIDRGEYKFQDVFPSLTIKSLYELI